MTLTKREKTLLYILLCTIILIGGIFLLILPSFQSYNTAKTAYDTAEMQLAATKAEKIDYTNLDKNLKKATKDLSDIKKKFYSEMEKEEIDHIITELAIAHLLEPVNLNISDVVEEEVVNYSEYVKQKNNTETKPTEDKTDKAITWKVYNVSLVLNGDIANIQALVDAANQLYSMKVASVQYADQDQDVKQMTVTFKIFMI